jgi:hypothetical protein
MLTLVRSALAGVCLVTLSANGASALQCIRPEMTDAILLRWTEVVAFVTVGPSRQLPDGQTCVYEAKVVTPVKGALVAGQSFTASYNGWDGCSDGSGGKPTLEQYYRNGAGDFEISLCTFLLSQNVVDAYVKQKTTLERSAAKHPGDLGKQLALAGFYVGWGDDFRAAPAAAEVMKLAPTDPRARLLKARSDLLSVGADAPRPEAILEELVDLQKDLPIAKVLYERTKRSIDRLNKKGSDGKLPELPPSTLPGIDLTGQDLTGFWLGGIVLDGLVAPRSD